MAKVCSPLLIHPLGHTIKSKQTPTVTPPFTLDMGIQGRILNCVFLGVVCVLSSEGVPSQKARCGNVGVAAKGTYLFIVWRGMQPQGTASRRDPLKRGASGWPCAAHHRGCKTCPPMASGVVRCSVPPPPPPNVCGRIADVGSHNGEKS